MSRNPETPPGALVADGQIAFGVFDKPIRTLNLEDADQYRGAGRLRLKQWLGFAIEHPDWHLCVFLLDAGYLASANVYAHHRATGRSVRHARVFPPGGPRLARNLYDDRCEFRAPGFEVLMRNHADAGRHTLRVFAAQTPGRPGVRANLVLEEDLARVTPLTASLPLRNGRTVFTHKAPLPATGEARVGGERITFRPDRDTAIMDEHKSFMPHRIRWRWATLAGRDAAGRLVGVNLCDTDAIDDPQQWSENCLWAGRAISLLGPATLDFHTRHPARPWSIMENSGRVRLRFFPDGCMRESPRIGPVGMDYFQMSGRFRGTAVDDSGQTMAIDNLPGVAEAMDARW